MKNSKRNTKPLSWSEKRLKAELDKVKETKKRMETSFMATIGTVQRLSAELAKPEESDSK